MQKANKFTFLILCTSQLLFAQNNPTTLSIQNAYNGWGWDSVYVIENGLIKTSIFPSVGGRVLEYDLAENPSMYVNENNLGFMFSDGSPWDIGGGIGGYKVWPAPQSNWNWPPPPVLSWGEYDHEILINTTDSVAIYLTGQRETTRAPGIRFERRYTFYKNSSRVKVDQIVINENTSARNWGVWDVTQSISHHQGETDYDNFRVYFPINPQSHYGNSGVRTSASSPAWLGEVATGIYAVRFRPENKKIFADPHIGWICYVDELEGYAYAKTFKVFEEANYPDDQARVAVWINGNPDYLEVEVMSPVENLAANGGSYTFTENWWAAKVIGPILNVNNAGAVAGYAVLNEGKIQGTYGVFHNGFARLVFLDGSNADISSGPSYPVSPLETFILNDSTQIPESAVKAHLEIIDAGEALIAVLDSISFSISALDEPQTLQPGPFTLLHNYPNPFNPQTTISYRLTVDSKTMLRIYDILGHEVQTLVDTYQAAGNYSVKFSGSDLPSGIYFYTLTSANISQTGKMLLLK